MIYFPSHAPEDALRAQARAAGLSAWENERGELIGWKSSITTEGARPAHRLVVFHGNAGFAVNRKYYGEGFAAVGDGSTWEVFILEYPGYGARPGDPGEAAFIQAGAEALESLWRHDDRPLFLLGESIGSGVACALASRFSNRIPGLVLITPFTSLAEVGAHHYPALLVRLLLKDRYDNRGALNQYAGSLAVVLAGQDEVVPAELGQRLYDGYRAGPKRLWVQSNAGHNTLDLSPGAAWWAEVSEFLLSATRSPANGP